MLRIPPIECADVSESLNIMASKERGIMELVYAGNWFALGACIYGRKSPDEALKVLGLQIKPRKKNRYNVDIEILINMRREGLTIRQIAAACDMSFAVVRKRL
jgi:hypothetical protein